ncbi:hypothetical protein U1Q18_045569 [Sarracenia purpurea var. burkii]
MGVVKMPESASDGEKPGLEVVDATEEESPILIGSEEVGVSAPVTVDKNQILSGISKEVDHGLAISALIPQGSGDALVAYDSVVPDGSVTAAGEDEPNVVVALEKTDTEDHRIKAARQTDLRCKQWAKRGFRWRKKPDLVSGEAVRATTAREQGRLRFNSGVLRSCRFQSPELFSGTVVFFGEIREEAAVTGG